jgi:hypothetical protein
MLEFLIVEYSYDFEDVYSVNTLEGGAVADTAFTCYSHSYIGLRTNNSLNHNTQKGGSRTSRNVVDSIPNEAIWGVFSLMLPAALWSLGR